MYRILIIEDDHVVARVIAKHLSDWGFITEYITDFKNILDQFIKFDPQMVFLDTALPCPNRYHLYDEIRKISKVPIIFISSAGDNMNVAMTIHMGNDDFNVRSFDLPLLATKAQAMLYKEYDLQEQVNILQHKDAMLNLNDATLTYNEKKVQLTNTEFCILQILMENTGEVVSREKMKERLWGYESDIRDNALSVRMNKLRRKLEKIELQGFITTKQGVGYKIDSL